MGSLAKLQGKTAIVTGAASGIGLEYASFLYQNGCSVILIDLNPAGLESAKSRLLKEGCPDIEAPEVFMLHLDLTSDNFLKIIDDFLAKHNLEPEILINNAGIFSFAPIVETSEKKVTIFIDLHVRAVSLLSRWFCNRRKRSRSGWLLNMSSMSCWMPMPGLALYASTKAYIRAFSRALHYEMKDDGVKVMVTCPGGIATDLFGLPKNLQKFAVNIGVLDTPEKFVKKAVKKMLKGKAQYINGPLNRFSIFFIGITPDWARMMVKHKLLDRGIKR